MDGGSNDRSQGIIERYSHRVTHWVSEKDRGQADAINKGWKIAKGEIFSWLNADDTLLPGAVSRVVQAFLKKPSASIVYGNWTYMDEDGRQVGLGQGRPTTFKQMLLSGQIKFMAQPASFYNAQMVRESGYLDPVLHFAMDYDLLLKLAKKSSAVHLSEPIAGFRIHESTKSNTYPVLAWKERIRVVKKHSLFFAIPHYCLYLRYRVFCVLPESFQRLIRSWRNSINDKIPLSQ